MNNVKQYNWFVIIHKENENLFINEEGYKTKSIIRATIFKNEIDAEEIRNTLLKPRDYKSVPMKAIFQW